MPLQLRDDIAARLAARMPGRKVEDLRIITARGEIVRTTDVTPDEAALIASHVDEVEVAGGPPMLTNGLPTIIRIVAWLGHEGINKNRLAFVANDLGPAADRIREPNFLVLDWNHSAVLQFSFDQKAIGLWYRAEKRWDPNANNGAGAYGILAQGVVWAWAFPEYADKMLAEQERNGHLDFSMACLPESIELARNADGPYEIAHNPVFLTLSALDLPPADPDAIGLGKEGSDNPQLEQQLTQQLTGATAPIAVPTREAAAAREPVAQVKEEQMDELKAVFAAIKARLAAAASPEEREQVLAAGIVDINTAFDAFEAKHEQALAQLKQEMTVLETQNATLETARTEAETARDAFKTEAETLKAEAETLKATLAEATAKLDEISAKEAAAAKLARYTTRLATLPESYREALEKRSEEDRTRFETKWREASDEAWAEFQSEIEFAFSHVKLSYQERSQREGGALLAGQPASDDIAAVLSSINKK